MAKTFHLDFGAGVESTEECREAIAGLRAYLEKHVPGSCLLLDHAVEKWKITFRADSDEDRISKGLSRFVVIPTPAPLPTEQELLFAKTPPVRLVLHHPHPDPERP